MVFISRIIHCRNEAFLKDAYSRPSKKIALSDSFCRVFKCRCQITGMVRLQIAKSISRLATPFQR